MLSHSFAQFYYFCRKEIQMKIFLFSLLSLFLFVSCHDLKKQKQLKELDALTLTLSEVSEEMNEIDSSQMELVFKEVMHVRTTIQEYYQNDTLSIELGQDLEDYHLIAKQAKWVMGNIPFAKEAIAETQERIHQLRTDVMSGNGEREKYDSYIQNEKEQVEELKTLHQSLVKNSSEALEKHKTLHENILKFSSELRLKMKEL